MADPLGFFLLLAVGVFAVVLGFVGIRRGKAITIFRHSREESPEMFWFSILFQLGLGIVCLVSAVTKILI